MPEGPSIVILREQTAHFAGHTILRVEGDSKIDRNRLLGRTVQSIHSWGKHYLIELEDFSVRIHLLLFGSYRIDERKEVAPRLGLAFDNGELNFYSCSVALIEEPLEQCYDWRIDIMSSQWDPGLALHKLQTMPNTLVCDALLDQQMFAGAGNIFKNEVLFRTKIHPMTKLAALPAAKLEELVAEMRQYAFDFLQWKKDFVLKQHWQAHRQSTCPRCQIALVKAKLGKTNRQSFFCEGCQKRYIASDN